MTGTKKEGLTTVALFVNGKVIPMRVVSEKRQDIIPERKYNFEIPPPPIPESAISERITTEVAVVGGGLSGMSAAISAAEVGGHVVLIEKTPTFQARGGDNGYIGSRLQKKLGIEIDKGGYSRIIHSRQRRRQPFRRGLSFDSSGDQPLNGYGLRTHSGSEFGNIRAMKGSFAAILRLFTPYHPV